MARRWRQTVRCPLAHRRHDWPHGIVSHDYACATVGVSRCAGLETRRWCSASGVCFRRTGIDRHRLDAEAVFPAMCRQRGCRRRGRGRGLRCSDHRRAGLCGQRYGDGALNALPLGCVAAATKLQRLAIGTAGASTIAWSGVSNSAVTRVVAACFLAAAVAATGLDRRIALAVLSTVDARPAHDVIGTMVAGLGAMSRTDSLRRFRSASVVPFTLDSGVGTARLRPHAAGWRSEPTVHALGPGQASAFAMLMLPCAFLIAAQPGLASATMPGCMSHAA